MKNFKKFFAVVVSLTIIAVATVVYAEYIDFKKGDLRVNNGTPSNSVSVNAGNETLTAAGDVKVTKTVSKTNEEGIYNVTFDISGKEKVNTSSTPIYAVVVFDNSGSMICDYSKESYAQEKIVGNDEDYASYTATLGDGKTVYCSNAKAGNVVLANKWESAVKGAKSFTNEILNIEGSKISYVTFESTANQATNWYTKGDTIPSKIYSHPVGGTNLYDGLVKAQKKLNTVNDANAIKVIIVISDGEPTEPTSLWDANYAVNEAKNKSNNIKNSGIKIYTIGYDVAENSTPANILKSISSNTKNDNTYAYIAGVNDVNSVFTNLATTITTTYATNGILIDTIGDKFTYVSSDNGVVVEGNKVKFNIDKLTSEGTSFSFLIKIDDSDLTEDGWYPTNDGFELQYTDVNDAKQTISSNENPEVYWEAKKYEYTIHYFFDGVEDTTLIETKEATLGTKISTYTDNKKVGYKLEKIENLPLTISKKNNVINVYYVKDEFNYKVEYYYDNIIDTSKTENSKATYNSVIEDYTDKNITGYKLEKTENLPLTISENVNNNIIKVYYEKESYGYIVNYYKDSISSDNFLGKIEGNALYGETIKADTTLFKPAYYEFVGNTPSIVIKESGNVMNVVYQKSNEKVSVSYTVEHYVDGKLIESDNFTENNLVWEGAEKVLPVSYKIDLDKYVGYYFDEEKSDNLPEKANDGDVFKLYYEKKSYGYIVNYYKDSISSDNFLGKIEGNALYGETIKADTTLFKPAYYEFVENTPSIVIKESGNVMNVVYQKSNEKVSVSYTVEHYVDGKLIESDNFTENNLVWEGAEKVLPVSYKIDLDKYVGYYFDEEKSDTLPEKANDGDVFKLYYEKNTYIYTVNYYFDEKLDESKTEVFEAKYSDIITEIEYKDEEGYKLEKVENLPLTISENENNNVINVYYVSDGIGTVDPITPVDPIEPPHTTTNGSIYMLLVLVNILGMSVVLKKREN